MLPPDVHAPATARSALRSLPLGDRATDVLLLASELVAGAVAGGEHADDDAIELSASSGGGLTHVEVRDHGYGLAAHELTDGYGLRVLTGAAERWGIEHDGMTRIWFEIETARE
jgi:anti-sigma regulatory factor (Ser/Thr protein kinase)